MRNTPQPAPAFRSCMRILLPAVCLAAAIVAYPSAQGDLDTLMSDVLTRRDDNWKKLQQYTLTERETLQITALAVFRLFGFEREYLWFPREGFFVRSPLKADGVAIDEERRRREEDEWLKNAQNSEKRRKEGQSRRARAGARAEGDVPAPLAIQTDVLLTGSVEDVISQTFEPGFIRSANFMEFKFDEGQYALAGRERMLDRDVLKIEYYPKQLFNDAAGKPCRQKDAKEKCDKGEELEADIERKLNKVSLATLWVDPKERQILRYEFRFQDMDFLPGRSIVRVESSRATMQMAEPFTNVWLPDVVTMRFRVGSAAGPLEARYDVKYRDYRLPEVSGRVR
jgi:hypothetical protein